MDHPLTEYRRKKGLTLEQFGVLVGVKKSAVSKWEDGGIPRPGVLAKIIVATEGEIGPIEFFNGSQMSGAQPENAAA